MKMKCVLCDKGNIEIKQNTGDCVIGFLDEIKYHYLSFKTKLNDSESEIKELKLTNIKLRNTIEELQTKLNNFSSPQKRRKTNSMESLKEPDKCAQNKGIMPDNSTDDLNEAINGEDNWSDIFLAPSTQEMLDEKNTTEVNKNPTEINLQSSNTVKSINKEINFDFDSPNETILPKRCKSIKREVNNENINFLNTKNWLSTRQKNNRGSEGLTKDRSVSFLQPFKSPEHVNKNNSVVGQTPELKISPNSRKKLLSLNKGAKLRQTTLDFNKHSKSEETFCEDLVAPSPTSLHLSSKLPSIRKQSTNLIKNSPISSMKKPNSSSYSAESIGPSPGKVKIKTESIDSRKSVKVNLFKKLALSPRKNEPDDDDLSVCIIPSQPDDVVIVEDTEADAASADLLRDMMFQDDHLLQYLRDPRTARTLKPNTDQPETLKQSSDEKTPPKQKKLLDIDCSDCAAYFKYIGKDLNDDDLEKRMRNCKQHKVALHHTPEGFWDPDFIEFPADDPRNLTLIDTRFIDEKK